VVQVSEDLEGSAELEAVHDASIKKATGDLQSSHFQLKERPNISLHQSPAVDRSKDTVCSNGEKGDECLTTKK
jgi:hypothetical protein